MKQWTRLPTKERCGACGMDIAEDAPVCFVSTPDMKRRLLRCVACAGPPPENLIAPRADRLAGQQQDALKRQHTRDAAGDNLTATREAQREWVPYADKE